jgi:hypothetical protein
MGASRWGEMSRRRDYACQGKRSSETICRGAAPLSLLLDGKNKGGPEQFAGLLNFIGSPVRYVAATQGAPAHFAAEIPAARPVAKQAVNK